MVVGQAGSETAPAGDLAHPQVDWHKLDVPLGWDPIRNLCLEVAQGIEALTDQVVHAIQKEIPAYRDLPAVPKTDLTASVRANLQMILVGIAERRGPTDGELAVRRELGYRRALQGQPVDAIIQAFEIGYREIWKALVDASGKDEETRSLLLQAVLTVWTWVQEVSSAVAEAYRTTLRNREALAAAAQQRFFELLDSGDLESEELSDLTTSLGFESRGRFQAAIVRADAALGDERLRIGSALRFLDGTSTIAARGSRLLVLFQKVKSEAAVTTIRQVVPEAHIALGLARDGLRGARLSVGDAERTLHISNHLSGTTSFEQHWLLAVLHQSQERLHPLLEKGREAAGKNPDFAATVNTFAVSGFSVSETARAMNLHANTVIYRLKRWEELTGWNLKSFEGLVASIVAVNLPWETGASSQ